MDSIKNSVGGQYMIQHVIYDHYMKVPVRKGRVLPFSCYVSDTVVPQSDKRWIFLVIIVERVYGIFLSPLKVTDDSDRAAPHFEDPATSRAEYELDVCEFFFKFAGLPAVPCQLILCVGRNPIGDLFPMSLFV